MIDKKLTNNAKILFCGLIVCFISDMIFIAADVIYGTAKETIEKYAGSNISFIAFIIIMIGLFLCIVSSFNMRKQSKKIRNAMIIFIAGFCACLFQIFNTFFVGMILSGGFEYGMEFAPVFQYMWFEGVDVMLAVAIIAGFAFSLYGMAELASKKFNLKAFKKIDGVIILFAVAYGIGEAFEITIISNLDNTSLLLAHTAITAVVCAVGMLVAYLSLIIWFIKFVREISQKIKSE